MTWKGSPIKWKHFPRNHDQTRGYCRLPVCESGGELLTFLLAADDPSLDREPLLAQARSRWLIERSIRKPYCISCRASFAGAAVRPGSYLFATTPRLPGVASIAAGGWNFFETPQKNRA
jgi:hypothetical protein